MARAKKLKSIEELVDMEDILNAFKDQKKKDPLSLKELKQDSTSAAIKRISTALSSCLKNSFLSKHEMPINGNLGKPIKPGKMHTVTPEGKKFLKALDIVKNA